MVRVLDITSPDINAGTGCRATLWVSGCKFHCEGCHNRWAQDYGIGLVYQVNKQDILNRLHEALDHDYISGLTLSGGDPLAQPDGNIKDIIEIVKHVRAYYPTKNIWIFSGYMTSEYEEMSDLQKELLSLCDVWVEGRFILAQRDIVHYPFRGSANQRLIDVKKFIDGDDDFIHQLEP